tara:strand:+ start:429 stop:1313 length:885 start_codon:yes stop_codon:yes gene_type:complete
MSKLKPKYLFVGLGTMGYSMAGHLSKLKDIDLFIFNRSRNVSKKWLFDYKGQEFIKDKCSGINFNGLILCLKDDASILSILLKKKFIEHVKPNGFILDHSTTSLELIETVSLNNYFSSNNLSYFDAPVSGGEIGAIKGNLSIMIGGPNRRIKILKKLMSSYSKSIIKVGPSGHGQLTKMVNQLCIAGLLQGLSEAIILGKTSNLNMNKVFEAISGGAAQSWQMDNRFKTMVDDNFDFGFAVDLMIKDLRIALQQANFNNLNLKTSKAVLKNYQKLSSHDHGNLDTSSLIKLFNS